MIYEDETSEKNNFFIKIAIPNHASTFVLTFAFCPEKLWENQFIALSLSVPCNLPQLFLNILKLFT